MKRALICGVTGQDGAYLAELLVGKGYEVHGTTRADPAVAPANLAALGIAGRVRLHRMAPADGRAVSETLEAARPDEIYYLAAQSSVWRSFQYPLATFEGSATGLVTMIEAARAVAPGARLVSAASGDCFGETSAAAPASEDSPFRPRSPYAAAKCAGHHALAVARLAYGQFACSAFLFTHESALRPETFAFGKIVAAVKRIAAGSDETLELGDVEVVRDWGWAPEYVDAMWRMLQQDEPLDHVIATGRSYRLAQFVEAAFAHIGRDWRDHVRLASAPQRPTDIRCQHADPSRAGETLGWEATSDLRSLPALLLGNQA